MSAMEFTIGRERDVDGNMLVAINGQTHGTVENLKSVVDGEVEREILRKLRAAGVSLTLLDGQPQINVPASASHLVKVEGKNEIASYRIKTEDGKGTGFRLELVDGKTRFAVDADQFIVTDGHSIDPCFARRVEAVVRDAQKKRRL